MADLTIVPLQQSDSNDKPAQNKPIGMLNAASASLDAIGKISTSIFRIVLLAILIISIFSLVGYVLNDEDSIVIQPFQVTGFEKVSGESITNHLNWKLNDIKGVYDPAKSAIINRNFQPRDIESMMERTDDDSQSFFAKVSYFPQLEPESKAIKESLSGIGSVGVDGNTFSLGNLILSLKAIAGHQPPTISGIVQRYGPVISIVAVLQDRSGKESNVWELRVNYTGDNKTLEKIIPGMVEDLAFKIFIDRYKKMYSSEDSFPMTWQAFKNLTEARKEYNNYIFTGSIDSLDRSMKMENLTRNLEPGCAGSCELDLLFDLASANQKEGRLNYAKDIYEKIFALRPFEVSISQGRIYLQAGGNESNYKRALSYFIKATEIDPRSSLAWIYRGIANEKLGQYEDAVDAYDRAIRLDRRSAKAWTNKGWALFVLGRFNESLVAYENAIKMNSSYATARDNLGALLENQGKYEEALDSYELSLKLDPQSAIAWNGKGKVLFSLKLYNESIDAYDNAIRLDPNWAMPWHSKGLCFANMYDRNGKIRYSEALEAINRSCELSPQWAYPLSYKGLLLTRINQTKNKREAECCYNKSLDLAEEALNQNPKDAQSWYAKGYALSKMNRYKEAAMAYRKSADLAPGWAEAWNNLGCALLNNKENLKAIEALNNAIRINPKYEAARTNIGIAMKRIKIARST